MPTQEQYNSTTAEYASSLFLGGDDVNKLARGYDLGPDEAQIIAAVVQAINDRRLTNRGQSTRTIRKREVSLTQGRRRDVVRWYEYTNSAGPVRASFDLGDEAQIAEYARGVGGNFDDMKRATQAMANDWSATNLARSNAMLRMVELAIGLYVARAKKVYLLTQQTGRADERAAELAAEETRRVEDAGRRIRSFIRNPTSLDSAQAQQMLERARTLSPAVQARLAGKVERIGAEEPTAEAAEVVEAAAAELAAEDRTALDVLYPLAGPDYYTATLASLPEEWALLLAAFVLPDITPPDTVPDATVYLTSWPTLDRAWQNLVMHIVYTN